MSSPADPHAGQPVLQAGAPLAGAKAAVILIHGRGAGAEDMIGLASHFARPGVCFLAPQANTSVWYPLSFLAPVADNQPWLDSALAAVGRLVVAAEGAGIPAERILIGGFSQGACLASEYSARNPRRYGGVFALSGGLIGDTLDDSRYRGALAGTPVFVGCSDVDFHIPLERVRASADVMRRLGGVVDERIYPGMGHTVNEDELTAVGAILDAATAT